MLITADKNVSVYFGDAVTNAVDHKSPTYYDFCLALTRHFQLDNLVLQHQIHGLDGEVIEQKNRLREVMLFEQDGDWLITNQKNVGIGILTADCLPIVFYDPVKQVVGIAHAGWKGTVAGIAQKVVDEMHKHFASTMSDLRVIFGPSACACCYEVGPEFQAYVADDEQLEKSLTRREGKLFFDKTCYNTTKLLQVGVSPQSLVYQYNSCTICNYSFHSHRRKGILRQISIVFVR